MSSELRVDKILPVDGAPTNGGGGIIQVVSAYVGSRFTTSSVNMTDITGLSVTITPRFSSSKILVQCCMGAAGTRQSNLDHGNVIRTVRSIGGGSFSDDNKLNGLADGSRLRITYKGNGNAYNDDHMPGGYGFVGLDDPNTTAAVIYKVQVQCQLSSYPFYLNGTHTDGDGPQTYRGRSMSTLIAMEVSA